MAYLQSLHIYPIKSTAGHSLDRADCQSEGLAGDRRFLVTDPAGGFLTARAHPSLVRVQTQFQDASLLIQTPGRPPVTVPLQPTGGQTPVQVWKDRFPAWDCGPKAADWWSSYLGTPARLVALGNSQRPLRWDQTRRVSFADAAPLLGLGQGSLDQLSTWVGRPQAAARFRPNLVFGGTEPFEEDTWRRFRIGPVEFLNLDGCGRCEFTCIDPDTGVPDPDGQPLATLQARRANDTGVYFAMNALPINQGPLEVGHPVTVLERRRPLVFPGIPSTAAVDWLPHPHPAPATDHLSFELVCTAVRDEAPDFRAFTLERTDGQPLSWRAGQYLTVEVRLNGQPHRRSYSLIPGRTPHTAVIAVKRLPGGLISNWLHDHLGPSGRLVGLGIQGHFTLEDHPWNKLVFFSAGSGLTPFLSLAQAVADHNLDVDIVWHHSVRHPADLAFTDRLADLRQRLGPRLTWQVSFTAERRLDHPTLMALVPDLRDYRLLACGPVGYRQALKELLISCGVKIAQRYHEELYGEAGLAAPTAAQPGQLVLTRSGLSLHSDGRTTLLHLVEAAGLPLPSTCRSGDCGSCRVRVTAGQTTGDTVSALTAAQRDAGWVQACVTYPVGDLQLDL